MNKSPGHCLKIIKSHLHEAAGECYTCFVLRNFVSTWYNVLRVVSMATADRSNEFCVFWTNATESLLPSGLLGIPWSLCFRWSNLRKGKILFVYVRFKHSCNRNKLVSQFITCTCINTRYSKFHKRIQFYIWCVIHLQMIRSSHLCLYFCISLTNRPFLIILFNYFPWIIINILCFCYSKNSKRGKK